MEYIINKDDILWESEDEYENFPAHGPLYSLVYGSYGSALYSLL